MTTRQLYLFNCLYLVITAAVAILTRATPRRIAGALSGAALAGVAGLGIVVFGESAGWWHMAITWEPYFIALVWIDFALCAYVFLITWRIARVLVQPEMENGRFPLVSIPPFGRDFQGMGVYRSDVVLGTARQRSLRVPDHRLDEPTGLSLSMVASPHCPLPFRPAR